MESGTTNPFATAAEIKSDSNSIGRPLEPGTVKGHSHSLNHILSEQEAGRSSLNHYAANF